VIEPIWLDKEAVMAFHEAQLREHGGLGGIRDESGLDGALARPLQLFHYEKTDLCALAAAYAHGIAKSHSFNDGNKRTALASAIVFLEVNGIEATFSEPKAIEVMLGLASGKMSQKELADFFRGNTAR
jgi:death-on-curing protein